LRTIGIAGMLGSGRTELLRAIFGADSFNSGGNQQKVVVGDWLNTNPNGVAIK